jgi:hypothetical protein
MYKALNSNSRTTGKTKQTQKVLCLGKQSRNLSKESVVTWAGAGPGLGPITLSGLSHFSGVRSKEQGNSHSAVMGR